MILEKIKGPEEIKPMSPEELEQLAQEIRAFLIEKISLTGGHLASNLGCGGADHCPVSGPLNLPKDKVIWDVGHQSYTHKILSGRMAEFRRAAPVRRPQRLSQTKGEPLRCL